MNRRNYSSIGDEIKDIVQNAVNTKDFHQINRDIGNTINSALDEVRSALGAHPGRGQRMNNPNDNLQWKVHQDNHEAQNNNSRQGQGNNQNDNNEYSQPYKGYWQSGRGWVGNNASVRKPPVKRQNELIPNVPVGRISGTLLAIFGSIGIGTTVIAAFVLLLIGQLIGKFGLFESIALGLIPLFCVSFYMSAKGSQIRKRLKRFRRYLKTFEGRSYYSIKELSVNSGLSRKYILKDLRKMITIGMFPEGHIDEQETCLILNRESYQQYLELQKNISKQKSGEQEVNKSEVNQRNDKEASQNQSTDTLGTELKNALSSGRECIRQIKEANDSIPGDEISKKLYRLEDIISKIFNYVELHPAQLPEIQKFMDYYLPTTLKLVNAYKEFDKQSIQGENITAAKNEIESTLDTINIAFEKLFDSLFEDTAMDVSTDISVLETLLAQEGLTQREFKANRMSGGQTNE